MEMQEFTRKSQYRSALYTERAGLTVRVIPILMGLAALFTFFFTGVYVLLDRPAQWFVMLGAMLLTFCLFSLAYIVTRRDHADISVYIVVIALNILGAAGAIALEGWFAMSVLLAYVSLSCARLFTGRLQNRIVVVITTIAVIAQIILTYFGPISKYTNPNSIQIMLWIGYVLSGLFVVGYISDIQDQRQEQLLEHAGIAADQLQSQATTLEIQTVSLQRRTDFLLNIMRVIQDLGHPQRFTDMVTLIVQNLQKEFGFYHVAYYKVSGPLEPAILLDAAGDESAAWKDKHFQVNLDEQDPIAVVARLGQPIIGNENDNSISHTIPSKSRVTLPLRLIQSGIVGVLDIQDRDTGIFKEGELLMMQMLGEQLSQSLEATRRYEDVNQRLINAMRSSREANLASWREWMQVSPRVTYHYQEEGTKMLAEQTETKSSDSLKPLTEFSFPLSTAQGEVVGKVTAHKLKTWTTAEIALLESLIEQVEQTLENARLYQATHRRSVREQMTRRITGSIRSALSVEDAIRRAVTELAQAVDASEVNAQLNVERGDHYE